MPKKKPIFLSLKVHVCSGMQVAKLVDVGHVRHAAERLVGKWMLQAAVTHLLFEN